MEPFPVSKKLGEFLMIDWIISQIITVYRILFLKHAHSRKNTMTGISLSQAVQVKNAIFPGQVLHHHRSLSPG